MEVNNGLRLLSLDGGINGLPLLLILKSILQHVLEEENATRGRKGQEPLTELPRPSQYFDLIGGSGSGGIVASMLGRMEMGVEEAIDRYIAVMKPIYTAASGGDLGTPSSQQFASDALEKELQKLSMDVLGDPDAKLLVLTSPPPTTASFVCTQNSNHLNLPVLLRTYPSPHSVIEECTIWQACRATSASPGIFKSILIGRDQPFVGDLGCSNPTKFLLEEAVRQFPSRKVACIISIGTGHAKTISLSTSSLQEVALAIANDCQRTHEDMVTRFSTHRDLYFRFNVEQGLQISEEERIREFAAVESHTSQYLLSSQVSQRLRDAAQIIVSAVGKVETDRLFSVAPAPRTGNSLIIRPPPPSRVFTGRKDILKAIEDILLDMELAFQKRFVLYGLGGSGKTQIALEFIRLHSSDFSTVYIVNASSEQTIKTSLEFIGIDLNLPEPKWLDALDWFCRQQEQWLILFDNADDTTFDLNDYFPPCSHGNILITSRNRQSKNYAHTSTSDSELPAWREVHKMTPDDAVSILSLLSKGRKVLDARDVALLPTVAETLGHLALCLVQCGAYVASVPGMTFQKYLRMFATRRKKLLIDRPKPRIDTYEPTVYTTWEISFDVLTERSKSLLEMCSFLHFDGITAQIFTQAALNFAWDKSLERDAFKAGADFLAAFDESFPDEVNDWDDFELDQCLRELTEVSLVQEPEEGVLSIHPLVQSWCQDRATTAHSRTQLRVAQAIISLSADNFGARESYLHRNLLLPHIKAIIDASSDVKLEGQIADRLASALDSLGQYESAEHLYEEIIHQRMTAFGPEHPSTLTSQAALAIIYQLQGKLKPAADLQSQTLDLQREVLGSDHADTLYVMENLAFTYFRLGRYSEGEALAKESLHKRRTTLGDEHADTRASMSVLAVLYEAQGKHHEACSLKETILETERRILPPGDASMLATMSNLAATYITQGRYTDAAELQWDVFETRRNVLGTNHPDTMMIMSNLASTYSTQGHYTEAEELQREVVELRKTYLGTRNPDTLLSMNNLASTYSSQGRYKDAEELQREVLESRQTLLGTKHPDTLLSMSNLASTYADLGRYTEAEELQQEVLSSRKKLLDTNHPDTLLSMNNLASTYSSQGRYADAEELGRDVLELRRIVLGTKHPDTLRSMSNLAGTYAAQGRYTDAEELGREVVELRKIVLGTKHPDTLFSMNNLASTYSTQGRYIDAEELQREVLESRKIVLGTRHPDTLMSMSDMCCTYANQGRYREAETLQRDVFESRAVVLGREHPDTLFSKSSLANTYVNQGRHAEAEELQRDVLESRKSVLGTNHPDTLWSMGSLASMYKDQRRYTEAEELQQDVLKARKICLGTNHPDTLLSMSSLASTYSAQGRYKEAEELQHDVLRLQKSVLAANHPDTFTSMHNLALIRMADGRLDEAVVLLTQVVEGQVSHLGEEHPNTLVSIGNLALAKYKQGAKTEAEALWRENLPKQLKVVGSEHPDTLWTMDWLEILDEEKDPNEEVGSSGAPDDTSESETTDDTDSVAET